MQRWKHRPPGSNWGDYGSDDQIGRLNLITPTIRKKAFAEVKTGEVFCLSLPLDLPGGNILKFDAASAFVGWEDVVIGDPIARAYPASPSEP